MASPEDEATALAAMRAGDEAAFGAVVHGFDLPAELTD
jgi:hypothetical protein